jgi:hypothetical protein
MNKYNQLIEKRFKKLEGVYYKNKKIIDKNKIDLIPNFIEIIHTEFSYLGYFLKNKNIYFYSAHATPKTKIRS